MKGLSTFSILWLILQINFEVNSATTELIWSNLQEFFEGGWRTHQPQYFGVGTTYWSPSELGLSSLQPLDNNVTGKGVWSGYVDARDLFFKLVDFDYSGITEANITVKYYNEATNETFALFPCESDNEEWICYFPAQETPHWNEATFKINITAVQQGDWIRLFTWAERRGVILLDQVKFLYEK